MKFHLPILETSFDEENQTIKMVEDFGYKTMHHYYNLMDEKIIDKLNELMYHKLTNEEWELIQKLRSKK